MAETRAVWGIDIGQAGLKAVRLRYAEAAGQVLAVAFDYVPHPKLLSQPDAGRKTICPDADSNCPGIPPGTLPVVFADSGPIHDSADIGPLRVWLGLVRPNRRVRSAGPGPIRSAIWPKSVTAPAGHARLTSSRSPAPRAIRPGQFHSAIRPPVAQLRKGSTGTSASPGNVSSTNSCPGRMWGRRAIR